MEEKRAGTKLHVCTNPKCRTHSARSVGLSPEEKAARKKQAQEHRIQQENGERLLTEVYMRVPGEPGRHELYLIGLSCLQQLGHDSQHRIFKFSAWEATKTNAVNGGYAEYRKLARTRLEKATRAQIGKLLVVCAPASELYYPTYYGTASWKDSKLTRQAGHCKVNCDRILREAKEKLAAKPAKAKSDSTLQTSVKPTAHSKKR